MFQNLKLGSKFFITLVLISVIPLSIITFFNYFHIKDQLKQSTLGNLHAINDSRVAHINHFVQLRQEQAKELAGTYAIRQLNPQGSNSPRIIDLVQKSVESVFQEIKKTPRSDYRYIDKGSAIENISVWDIHGQIVANTNRRLIGKRMPFKFLTILYEKGAYFKGFERDELTGEKFLTILEGVRNWDTGDYSGVVFLKTTAKILNDITEAQEGLGKTGETYIIDSKQRMITESRFEPNAVLNLTVNTKGSQACFEGEKAPSTYRNYRGRKVLGVQDYLPDQQWCVLTEVEANEALAPVIVFRNRIIMVFAVLIPLVLFLVHLASQEFVVPILRIRDASLQVARGDYQATATVKNQDEIGDLSRAFNQMTKVLAMITSQLKEKNKILEKQKEELKKLDQLKSEFVSMVSHELRTPMSIIKGSLSQLLDEKTRNTKEITEKLLHLSLSNVNRLTTMVNDLLDLSKIEAGKVELRKAPMDITVVIREVCQGFEEQAKAHDLEMKTRFSSEELIVEADRDKMIQVFINLIGNSLKFVSKGFIEVSAEDQGDHLRCMVEDSGPGISKEDMVKVFSKFQQFGHKIDVGTKGTGLGLSISKGLVELHGGKIWLESEEGVGTKFIFELPKKA
ncbi:MAG: sensor histidine kinase [Candidatus Aceula meridiana]|nr:sensor histidine kinase [Candidatus Aceula meridiana]